MDDRTAVGAAMRAPPLVVEGTVVGGAASSDAFRPYPTPSAAAAAAATDMPSQKRAPPPAYTLTAEPSTAPPPQTVEPSMAAPLSGSSMALQLDDFLAFQAPSPRPEETISEAREAEAVSEVEC